MNTAFRVISMSASPRRQTFSRPPEELGLDWAFIDAMTVLGPRLHLNESLCNHINNRHLVRGEIGCFSSHAHAWQLLLDDPMLDQIIVLEDDVYADWNALHAASQINWRESNVDYLKFYAKGAPPYRRLRTFYPMDGYHIVQYLGSALGTQAYLLTRKGAEHFVRKLGTVERPVDAAMDRPWSTGLAVIGLLPSPVIELYGSSTIEGREMQQRSRSMGYLLGRLVEHARTLTYRWLAWPLRIQ